MTSKGIASRDAKPEPPEPTHFVRSRSPEPLEYFARSRIPVGLKRNSPELADRAILRYNSLYYGLLRHCKQGCEAGAARAGTFCPEPEPEKDPLPHFALEPEPSQICTTSHPRSRSRSRYILPGAGTTGTVCSEPEPSQICTAPHLWLQVGKYYRFSARSG